MRKVLFTLSLAMVLMASCKKAEVKPTFAEGEFKEWAKTPPMGWNSWDCYGPTVVED